MPAKFAGAQGAGPPPIFVRYWMRRVWIVAIVPASRVASFSPAFEAGRFLGSQGLLAGGRAALLVLGAARVLFNSLRTPRPHRMPLAKAVSSKLLC